jgi:hypothetical protein
MRNEYEPRQSSYGLKLESTTRLFSQIECSYKNPSKEQK